MKEKNQQEIFWRVNNPILWGLIFSAILLVVFVGLLSIDYCDIIGCQPKWFLLLSSSPNEIGDTLAGFAGSLAFLWIIVTVMLQSQELREQRNELRLQRNEFEKMREAQEVQATVLMGQHQDLIEQKTGDLFDEFLIGLEDQIYNEDSLAPVWRVKKQHTASYQGSGPFQVFDVEKFEMERSTFGDDFLKMVSLQPTKFLKMYSEEKEDDLDWEKSPGQSYYIELTRRLDKINNLLPSLGKDQLARYENLQLDKMTKGLEGIIKLKIWTISDDSKVKGGSS